MALRNIRSTRADACGRTLLFFPACPGTCGHGWACFCSFPFRLRPVSGCSVGAAVGPPFRSSLRPARGAINCLALPLIGSWMTSSRTTGKTHDDGSDETALSTAPPTNPPGCKDEHTAKYFLSNQPILAVHTDGPERPAASEDKG